MDHVVAQSIRQPCFCFRCESGNRPAVYIVLLDDQAMGLRCFPEFFVMIVAAVAHVRYTLLEIVQVCTTPQILDTE